ncbi:hypothetical protein GCM10007160_43210 [Litchfieldella qijiaojingensis]|uniref:Uncharacterized protein n=1 Tax=Litchfieldella qijiaojingensis TaxID=980347 RepID=A0ABQ2ZFZ5_9GAMM|nr:hypothetical protein GCM10007160_43210 [Halomonas qijiaojingensis]
MEQMEGTDARDLQQGIFLAYDQSLLCIQRCICLLLPPEVAETAVNNYAWVRTDYHRKMAGRHRVVQGRDGCEAIARHMGKISYAEYGIES